ncbi:MAG TPA: SsrA-binding protein SmpB [Caldithrix sp.]|nr:SsrA-binding protein SmpB [Calditrichaceae bacterium]HEM49291.1 SsrA-binding protein SmpB [Caldithrix sp.]
MAEDNKKIITNNRKARHDYEIMDTIETGIVLFGTEVKAAREGRINLTDAYARIKDGELWLIGMHISPYSKADMENHDPLRERKLLVHRMQIKRLNRQVEEKGVTLIPLKIYFNRHLIKVELGLVRGKRKYDKRASITERDQKRDLDRLQKSFR